MIFATSAGRVVFGAYKDRTPLPEVIARNNGHEETAHYLEELTTRYVFHVVIVFFFKLYWVNYKNE